LLSPAVLAAPPRAQAGRAVVGLVVPAGRAPSAVSAGQTVAVYLTHTAQAGQTDLAGEGPSVPTSVLVGDGVVLDNQASPPGQPPGWNMSVLVDRRLIPVLVEAAAAGRVSVVALGVGEG
jgi:hypothetical protein